MYLSDPKISVDFEAGRAYAKLAELTVASTADLLNAMPRAIRLVGVVGGGTMGAGIAVAMLDADLAVAMVERDEQSLSRGQALVDGVYDRLIAKGRLDPEGKAQKMARFSGSTTYASLAEVDLAIEAVFEDMETKKKVFAQLDAICKQDAVLATNTSYLDVDEIASSTSRPQDVLGLHFFSPANIMRLLEVVVPRRASPDAIATCFALAARLKKVAVRAGNCDGFIGNRILAACRFAADAMVEDGASPYQIDKALRDFGYAMGPFQVSDLAGGDIGWANRKRRASTRDPQLRYVQIADRLCERGWFGQKTGRGWYLYLDGARAGIPDPEVEQIIEGERDRARVKRRDFSDDEIVRRYIGAIVNEGCRVLEDKIAMRPLDIDVVFLNGYGFPRHRGGRLAHAVLGSYLPILIVPQTSRNQSLGNIQLTHQVLFASS